MGQEGQPSERIKTGERLAHAMALGPLYLALDIVSAALTMMVAAGFFRLWRRTREALDLLVATGFLVIGVSFLGVAASQFDLGGNLLDVDALRLAGQTAGAFVVVFTYASVRRHGSARFWRTLGWTALAGGLVLAVLYLLPPFAALPDIETALPVGHGLMAAAFAACAAMSARGFSLHPSLDRTFVPVAFLALALTQYTWLLIDLASADSLAYLVYGWRFVALTLLLVALRLPPAAKQETPDAPP